MGGKRYKLSHYTTLHYTHSLCAEQTPLVPRSARKWPYYSKSRVSHRRSEDGGGEETKKKKKVRGSGKVRRRRVADCGITGLWCWFGGQEATAGCATYIYIYMCVCTYVCMYRHTDFRVPPLQLRWIHRSFTASRSSDLWKHNKHLSTPLPPTLPSPRWLAVCVYMCMWFLLITAALITLSLM